MKPNDDVGSRRSFELESFTVLSTFFDVICFQFQARLKEAASLEKHVLLKKLRDALEALKGRAAGKNKDDVEEAIAMVGLFSDFLIVALFIVIMPNLKYI